jgi:hypothetical protein
MLSLLKKKKRRGDMESMGFEPLTTTHYLSLKEQPNTNAPCMCLGEKNKNKNN